MELCSFREHLLSTYIWSGSGPDTKDYRSQTPPGVQESRGHAEDTSRVLPVSSCGTALINIMSRSSVRLAYTLSSTLGTPEDTVPTSFIGRHHIFLSVKPTGLEDHWLVGFYAVCRPCQRWIERIGGPMA